METLETSDLIKILAVIVLGATGTYLLLPHKHGLTRPKLAHQIGFGLATLSVLAFTLLWKSHGVDLVSKFFFYLFAFSAVGGGILTILPRTSSSGYPGSARSANCSAVSRSSGVETVSMIGSPAEEGLTYYRQGTRPVQFEAGGAGI